MVKEFLDEVRRQEHKVKEMQEELEKMQMEIYSLKSPSLGERVQTSHQGDIGEMIEKMESMCERVNQERKRLLSMRDSVQAIFSLLDNPIEETVMRRRYILCQRYEEIGKAMNYSKDAIYKFHRSALWKLEHSHTAEFYSQLQY